MRTRKIVPGLLAVSVLVILLFCCAAHYAALMPCNETKINAAPDEKMRWELCEWLADHHTLPVGNEPELVANDWGYSYAFTPYLPAFLSSLMIRLTPAGVNLLFAARLVSAAAYGLLLLYAYLLGRELFSGVAPWCFALVAAALPQAFFCALYLNNDIVSMLSCFMIAYCMVSGRRKGWTVGCCIHLAISLAVCALSYYFAYGWILAAVIWCVADGKKSLPGPTFRRRILLVAGIAFLLAGWVFVRNAILYQGDIFGISAQHRQAEIEAAAGRQIHFGVLWAPTEENLRFWVKYTCRSFFAGFGAMDIFATDLTYHRYHLWLLVGAAGGLLHYAKKGNRAKGLLLLALILLPAILSLYRSLTYDWQYQGRYLFSAWPALCILLTRGYLWFGKQMSRLLPEKLRPATTPLPLVGASCCFILLSVVTVVRYLLPLCTGM